MHRDKSVIVVRIVFGFLVLYMIFGFTRKAVSAPVLENGGDTLGVIALNRSGAFLGLKTATFRRHAKTRRRIMSTGISMPPDSRYWRQLYRAALSEIDKSKLPDHIAEAEKAVVLRAREWFQAAGDNGEETEALDDVMYALHALRSNYQVLGTPV